MGQELLSSKTVLNEPPPDISPIQPVATAQCAAFGITERGPFGATLVTSPSQFRRLYGGYIAASQLPQAVDGFFGEGGEQMWISRVVHYADPTDPTSKTSALGTVTLKTAAGSPTAGKVDGTATAPFDLEPADTLVVRIDADVADQTATFNATAANRTDAGTYPIALADLQVLTIAIDGGSVQTLTFHTSEFVSIGAATAAEVAAAINGKLNGASATVVGGHVKITSDKRGTASGVNITGGSANAALVYTTGNTAGTGNVANIDAVTAAEVKTIVEAAITASAVTVSNVAGKMRITSNTTGTSSMVQVKANSTTEQIFGFDTAQHFGLTGSATNTLQVDGKTDGAYANAQAIKVQDPTDSDSTHFTLLVLKNSVVIETWPNLSMVSTAARYAPNIINDPNVGSAYIKVTDLAAAVSLRRPANGTSANMSGGADGLGSIADNDFIGGVGTNGRTGMRAFDLVKSASLLICPDRATSAVQNAMLVYCEYTRSKKFYAILDSPALNSALDIVTYTETTAALLEASEFGGMYWPRIKVLNPSTSIFGVTGDDGLGNIVVAPSGHIAGVFARTDASKQGGVYEPPAGIGVGKILSATGLETDEVLDEVMRDIVYPKRINPINAGTGAKAYIDGTKTLKSSGNFPTVAERRGVIFIEQSMKEAYEPMRHRNNNEELRAKADRLARDFLDTQTKNGAFRSKKPSLAYSVDSDIPGLGINSVGVQFAGQFNQRIGLATNKPTDFIILSISQDTRAFTQAQQ
jgi:hypothetical protein